MKSKYNYEFFIFIVVFLYALVICVYNHFNKIKFIHFVTNNRENIDNIYNNLNLHVNTEKNSKHFWNEDINNDLQKEISIINNEILENLDEGYKYVPSMTELYYSSKSNQNSDRQYVDNHMDGPFYACNLYRALVIVNGNKNIDTYFPDANKVINLQKYDIVLFDYNNELHYIDVNDKNHDDSQRIIIKLHYVKSNNNLCEKYHCEFGRETRDIFEINKTKLNLSGVLARLSLYYNTNRKYILFLILLLLLLLFYNLGYKNNLVYTCKFILYVFLIIETFGILYVSHFNFITRKVCR